MSWTRLISILFVICLWPLALLTATTSPTTTVCNCQNKQLLLAHKFQEYRSEYQQERLSVSSEDYDKSGEEFFRSYTNLYLHNNVTEKRDILNLGSMRQPFMGPRKRRRRRRTPSTSPYIVYATLQHDLQTKSSSEVTNEVDDDKNFQNVVKNIKYVSSEGQNLKSIGHSSSLVKGNLEVRADVEKMSVGEKKLTNEAQAQINLNEQRKEQLKIATLVWNHKNQNVSNQSHSTSITLGTNNYPQISHWSQPIRTQAPELHRQPITREAEERRIPLEWRRPLQKSVPEAENLAFVRAWTEYGPNRLQIPQIQDEFPLRKSEWVQFQPMGSEWDQRVGQKVTRPPEPGQFTRFLSSYIDFEINNYELTEFFRKVTFALAIFGVIIAWLFFGIFLRVIPHKWLVWHRRRNLEDDEGLFGNSIFKSLSERVSLALDGDWLTKLEEKVRSVGGDWLSTSVSCCILPNDKSVGQAECEVVRKARKISTFKCLSDLIYNLNFGPSESSNQQN